MSAQLQDRAKAPSRGGDRSPRKGRAASIVSQEWPLSREQQSETRRRHEEQAMQAEIRTICAHCGEFVEGPAADGTKWYAKHLKNAHPDFQVVETPRKRRGGRGGNRRAATPAPQAA